MKGKGMSQGQAEATVQKVLDLMTTDEVDEIVPDGDPTFQLISDAIMAWYVLLWASGVFRTRTNKQRQAVERTLAGSLLILGTLVKYTYALGMRKDSD